MVNYNHPPPWINFIVSPFLFFAYMLCCQCFVSASTALLSIAILIRWNWKKWFYALLFFREWSSRFGRLVDLSNPKPVFRPPSKLNFTTIWRFEFLEVPWYMSFSRDKENKRNSLFDIDELSRIVSALRPTAILRLLLRTIYLETIIP